MGVGAGLYMYVVVVQKFTFAISSPDEFLSKFFRHETQHKTCLYSSLQLPLMQLSRGATLLMKFRTPFFDNLPMVRFLRHRVGLFINLATPMVCALSTRKTIARMTKGWQDSGEAVLCVGGQSPHVLCSFHAPYLGGQKRAVHRRFHGAAIQRLCYYRGRIMDVNANIVIQRATYTQNTQKWQYCENVYVQSITKRDNSYLSRIANNTNNTNGDVFMLSLLFVCLFEFLCFYEQEEEEVY